MELIDPRILASTRDLVWLSQRIAKGIMLGLQPGRLRGSGIEFQQYRGYEPGDSIRNVDWKLFARSDRYFIREAEQESRMHVCIVLDTSASMAQSSFAVPQLNKLHYAKCWIATLCWVLNNQGDSFSLLALSDSDTHYMPEGRGQLHHRQLALKLEKLKPSGHWPNEKQLAKVWHHFDQPCQVVLISDFFEAEAEISGFATRLLAGKRPCLPLQLLVEAEQTFPFQGELKVHNPEATDILEIGAQQQREAYLRAFRTAQRQLTARFSAHECALTTVTIEQPLLQSLRNFIHAHGRVN